MDALDEIVTSGNMAVQKISDGDVLINLLALLLDPSKAASGSLLGERVGNPSAPNTLELANESIFMVNAGPLAWCLPMPMPTLCARGAECPIHRPVDYIGPYTHVEVWAVFGGPTPWGDGDSPTSWATYAHTVGQTAMFRRVPIELVRRLIIDSGGIKKVARIAHPAIAIKGLHVMLPSPTELQSCC